MSKYVNINGAIVEISEANISSANRSFKYGDGFFETMKLNSGKVFLEELHMKRLFSSLEQLQYKIPSHFNTFFIKENIKALVEANELFTGRIRLTISRGNGNLYDLDDLQLNFVIGQSPVEKSFNQLNTDGLQIGIYKKAIKPADSFSAIKSTNFLCYVMGAVWAHQLKINDAIILNQDGRLADTTIANVFIIKNGFIKTPAITEGCIAGVMRQYLLNKFRQDDLPVEEGKISIDDIFNASEVFLTNAIRGIQWVKQVEQSCFTNDLTKKLHQKYITSLFNS